ncbi:MAG: selenium cofactor biosynthesis protein YqeC [Clostridia bacterium]|nr:selenium cofactor biosynthesis protein YqeC [Clostridia bacterium]
MKFFDALNLKQGDVVALVGGGGKTSTMFAIGKEAKDRRLKTVLTTTTRIYCPDDPELAVVVAHDPGELFNKVHNKLTALARVIAGADLAQDNKLVGLEQSLVPGLLGAGADLVVVEADGAARKPFKAPADHEPVIPAAATVLIPVVGVDCLGQPLHQEYVHRPEQVAKLAGISIGQRITPEVVARVLTHPQGFRKGLPDNCRWIPFINKVESPQDLDLARKVALLVGEALPCRVIIGAACRVTPVVEVLDF